MNGTQVTMFVFSGLTDNEKILPFLFIFFSLVYVMAIIGNIGIIALVYNISRLHSPLYYFLSFLSLIDIFYASIITPKMIFDLLSSKKVISFNACALQFFFYAALGGSENFLLSTMSYDRYVAICHPLHYMSIMTKKKCLCLVSVAFSVGFFQSSVQTSCTFSLQFCGSNLIDHFYCDIPPLLKLSCSETFYCTMVTIYIVGIGTIIPFLTIIFSYIFILSSILRMTSSEVRKKAFSTCSSHLMCVSVFYVTVFFNYLRPPSSVFTSQDKVASIFYAVVTPMLNPLVYTLRNQEIKRSIGQIMCNPTSADGVSSVIRHRLGTYGK
ncbi:olfactory receptor 5B12-like [Bufo gargarizans]|uniref:olfactory receptor 5B12-like n=1 Tax=Bufo gargarizans TaxID=30331 RepID=UPI001CF1C737|nr:olfactory receptor 5B12-like [Bufo gargarizans]